MKIIIASNVEDNQGETLTRMGVKNRLLSFLFFKGKLDRTSIKNKENNKENVNEWLRTYVVLGQIPKENINRVPEEN